MTEKSRNNLVLAFEDVSKRSNKNRHDILAGREVVNSLHQLLTEYLVKLSERKRKLSEHDKKTVGEFYRFSSDINRISGLSVFISNITFAMRDNSLKFPDSVMEELTNVYTKVNGLFDTLISASEEQKGRSKKLVELAQRGHEIKVYCDAFSDSYLELIADKVIDAEIGGHYYNIMIAFRSMASYLTSIARTLSTKYIEIADEMEEPE